MSIWVEKDRPWSDYPLGTKARQGWMGSWWEKTEHGWKSMGGITFPYPSDANQVCIPVDHRRSA